MQSNYVLNLEKMPQKLMECFRLFFDQLAWNVHRSLSRIRDSRKVWSLWVMIRGVGGVRKSIHPSWLAKGLGLGQLCWGFKGVQGRDSVGWGQHYQDNAPVHHSILDYLTKMGIKTVPQPLYSPDLAPCDFCLFPKLRGRPLGLPEVDGTVQ